jgi:hypothetical protein
MTMEADDTQPEGVTEYRVDQQIGFFLRQANQRHVAIFAGRMGDRLTTTQWAALSKLKEIQPTSQNQLGRETAMDVATTGSSHATSSGRSQTPRMVAGWSSRSPPKANRRSPAMSAPPAR